jgi:phosphopantetheine adenylyltransferase
MFNNRYPFPAQNIKGDFQNREIDSMKNYYFASTTPTFDLKHISDMIYHPINQDVYYNSSEYPREKYYNFLKGSIYKDYVIPTSAYKFTVNDNYVSITNERKKISLTEYVSQIDQAFKEEINKIYTKHGSAVLSYSGGIDSIVVLSYIIAAGLLPYTTIITHENKVQNANHPDLISNNPDKIKALDETLALLSSRGAQVIKLDVTDQDLFDAYNNGNYFYSSCYTVTTALKRFNNTAFIFGHHGNQSLLHKDIFIDQILLLGLVGTEEIQKKIDKKNYYTYTLSKYNVNRTLTTLDYHFFNIRYWEELSGYQNNTVYSPLGAKLELCRSIDFSTVDVDVILNAKVARELITKNVGTLLDDYILREGINDGDVPIDKLVERKYFKDEIFQISDNINHNITGRSWLEDRLSREYITTFNLSSLKALQHLSGLHEYFGWAPLNNPDRIK